MNPAKVVVFASSYLDELPTVSPAEADAGTTILQNLSEASNGSIQIEYRCDRDPRQPVAPAELDGVVAVIADLEHYDAGLLRAVAGEEQSLRLIARYGVGVDSVDIPAATEVGILVTNTPGANSTPTAEWAVATLLDIAGRRLPHHERASRGLTKEGPSRLDVSGRTLGVVGTGAIGRTVIGLLKGFDMNILAYDPFPQFAWAEEHDVTYVSLSALLQTADFVTLHAASDRQIIGPDELERMKSTAALINCARGILVDNRAVYEAVRDGRLWGYGIDEIWPHPELPLGGLNIAASPHVGSDTDQGKVKMRKLSAEAVRDYLSGGMPAYALNPEARPDLR